MANDYDDSGTEPAEPRKDKGEATELLRRSFFGDKELKPGTRCEVEVVRVMDEQVSVKKVPESEYRDEDEELTEDSEIEQMMD